MTEYFVIITVQGVQDGYLRTQTTTAIGDFSQITTRAELFTWVQDQLPPDVAGLPVIFFSVEPNVLHLQQGPAGTEYLTARRQVGDAR